MCEHITEHALVEGIVRTEEEAAKAALVETAAAGQEPRSQPAAQFHMSTRSVSVVSTSPVTPSEYILKHPEGI